MFKWLKKNFFPNKDKDKYQLSLQSTKNNFANFQTLLKETKNIQESLLQSLENILIQSDFGVTTTLFLMQSIKDYLKKTNIKDALKLPSIILKQMLHLYENCAISKLSSVKSVNSHDVTSDKLASNCNLDNTLEPKVANPMFPQVYLFIGVNGVGKTTTIGKMAIKLKNKGKKVLLIAGDTFRAGAVTQLQIWGKRAASKVFAKHGVTSPSNVIFEGLQLAKKEQYDVVLCDTAGRLQNKMNLMQELAKINRVVLKHLPLENLQSLLVLDANTGQNALNQVAVFNEVVPLTGAILTKLDGTSKGGIVFSIKYLYNLPIKYIGLGEKLEDLIDFEIHNYLFHLFENFFPKSHLL
ncbi:signal recognition particle-docking protein FtsY ['Fragaria x ananassa' phyllody phytoplasma]|uniref:Signal recognition particle-docking protein FtsY n=1 Tax='Fragaria x ananassa' phyllody phytoplasma TaxID=2358428 RepID=A0ABS5K300_9MOLU|nr:signal recognition particle-docking protein FtsY ['Fragaria x ananassa' phyllody phytoplasma]MBS2126134.1 signal recognition particle-docking protein FtsY ['Fragaria x ananassa' phyllody phytoplasma]